MVAIEYYSYEDYKLWQGDWELIHGYPLAMSPRPDVVLICNEPHDAYITKSTAKRDEITKFELYEAEKVPYYIIVYPNDIKAKVYKLEDKKYSKVADFSDEVASFDGFESDATIDFERVFRRLGKRSSMGCNVF